MRRVFFIFAAIIALFFVGCAAPINAQSKVFIAPMENNFNDYLATAFIKNKVPVIITANDVAADYIIAGGTTKKQGKWYETVSTKDRGENLGSIVILRQSDKTVVWSGAKGDGSFWDALKQGGQDFWDSVKSIDSGARAKIANRIAKAMKKDFFNEK